MDLASAQALSERDPIQRIFTQSYAMHICAALRAWEEHQESKKL